MANCHNSHMGLTATFPYSSSSWYAVVADAVVGRCAPLDTACTRDAPQLPAAKKRTTESVHAGSRETTRPRIRREHSHLRAYAANTVTSAHTPRTQCRTHAHTQQQQRQQQQQSSNSLDRLSSASCACLAALKRLMAAQDTLAYQDQPHNQKTQP